MSEKSKPFDLLRLAMDLPPMSEDHRVAVVRGVDLFHKHIVEGLKDLSDDQRKVAFAAVADYCTNRIRKIENKDSSNVPVSSPVKTVSYDEACLVIKQNEGRLIFKHAEWGCILYLSDGEIEVRDKVDPALPTPKDGWVCMKK